MFRITFSGNPLYVKLFQPDEAPLTTQYNLRFGYLPSVGRIPTQTRDCLPRKSYVHEISRYFWKSAHSSLSGQCNFCCYLFFGVPPEHILRLESGCGRVYLRACNCKITLSNGNKLMNWIEVSPEWVQNQGRLAAAGTQYVCMCMKMELGYLGLHTGRD